MSYTVAVTRSGGGAVAVTRSDSGVKVVVAGGLGSLVSIAQAAADSAETDAAAAAASALAASGAAQAEIAAAIGVTIQAHDADLDAIAALTSAANKVPYSTGAQTWALADLTAFGRSLIDDADATAAIATLGLAALYQPLDADLTAIAALVSAANKIPYATGAGTWSLADFTAFGRSLVDDADATAAIATLGLAALYQPLDADLTAIAALSSAANKIAYATGSGTWSLTDFTSQARQLLDDTSFSAMLTTLGAQPLDTDLTAIAALVSAADQTPYATGSGTWSLMTVTAAARTVLDDTTVAAMLATLGGMATASYPTLVSLEGLSLVSGDVLYATAADTLARLAKGTDGQRLELASGVPSWKWPEETFGFAVSDETTAITTGTAKLTVRPWAYAFTISAVRASLNVASSSGAPTVDINEGGTTILSTKLTIDANELTSTTAATAAVISDPSIAADAEITIDIDAVGVGAKGLKVYITGRRT